MKSHFCYVLNIGLILFSLSAFGNTKGSVSISQESYVSPDYNSTDKKNFQFIGVGADTLTQVKNESEIEDALHAQVQANIAPGASVLNYLNVSQLFWKQNSLTVGRKKMVWSEIDEAYGLGMYQPNFTWNVLQPESQGLTGLFLNLEAKDTPVPVGAVFFASYLFVPDQGASYEIKDGKFEGSSPYFRTPPTQAEVNGQNDKIVYNLQRPKTEEIIFSRSFGAKGYLGNQEDGFYGQVAYADKPANQLTLGFQGVITTNNSLAVDILPAMYNHRLLSSDVQYTISGFSLGLSAMQENISTPKYSSEWTYPIYTNSQLFSPYIKAQFKTFKAKFSYLQLSSGEKTVVGPRAGLADSILPNRYPFQNAYSLELSYLYKIRKFKNINLGTKYLAGEKSEFALWTARGSYQWEERWSAFFESQMTSVDNTVDGKRVAYHPYMNNDTASIGVLHVF